jgi:hypothetical protein
MTAREDALAGLATLRREVDARAAVLAGRHAARLRCEHGCTECCRDGLTVFALEAEAIRAAHPELLARGRPHRPGRCAFLDAESGACRIYAERPYVCRTQGLPLRWFDAGPDGVAVELRDICARSEAGEPLETLPGEDCFVLGPCEGRLAALQRQFDGSLRRVPLRALFARDAGSEPAP